MRGLTVGLVLLTFALPLGAQAPPLPEPLPALGWSVGRTLGLWWTRQHDPNVSRTEVYHAVWLREAGAPDSAVFDFLPYLSPPREADGIALAYDAGLGGRMWSGVRDDNLVEGTVAAMGARVALELWRRLAPPRTEDPEVLQHEGGPRLLLRFGGEAPHAFASDGRDVEPLTRMAIAYADLDLPLRGLWQLTVGTRGYLYRVPGRSDDHDLSLILRLNRIPPSPGISVLSEWSWTSVWQRVWVQVERPFDYRGVLVRPVLRFCAGRDLPFALGFWPGGPDGFPGLDYGEGRGDREVTVGLHLSRHLGGRFTAHFTGAAGTTALGGPLLPETGWVAGLRAGLGIDTRLIGTLRVEPGITNDGRASVFLRVANWL